LVNQEKWLSPLKNLFSTWGNSPKDWKLDRGDFFQVEITHSEEVLIKALEIKALIKKVAPLAYSGDIGFFVNFGDYIYFRFTFLLITPFSMKIPVNIGSGSWSFQFFLLIIKYEIFTKIYKEPISCGFYTWTDGYRKKPNTNVLNMETND
jgi:hypothetical protein